MAVIGSATVTLTQYRDIQSVTRYYKLQIVGSSAPLKPETKPPSSDWTDSEPACDISKELYFCDLTIFSNGEGEYSKVSKSTSYEAAKEAYNKAQSAKDSIDNLEIGGRNLILNSETKPISKYIDAITTQTGITVSEWGTKNAIRSYGVCNSNKIFGTLATGSSSPASALGQTYVHSIYVKNNGKTPIIISNNGIGDSLTIQPGESTRVILHGTGDNARYLQFVLFSSNLGDAFDVTYWHPKIEKGDKATDWTPAPEDVDAGIANVQANLDNLEIGGRNLFLNTGKTVSNNNYKISEYAPANGPLKAGEIYTATICVTPAENLSKIRVYFSQGYLSPVSFSISGTSKQVISKTFTMAYYDGRTPDVNPSYGYAQLYRFPNDDTVTGNTTVHWFKIEKGNKATDWTPAPEDVDAGIANAANVAANYIHADDINGLVVNNNQKVGVGYDIQLKADGSNTGMNIRQNGNILASFLQNQVSLGKNSISSKVGMCGDKGGVSASFGYYIDSVSSNNAEMGSTLSFDFNETTFKNKVGQEIGFYDFSYTSADGWTLFDPVNDTSYPVTLSQYGITLRTPTSSLNDHAQIVINYVLDGSVKFYNADISNPVRKLELEMAENPSSSESDYANITIERQSGTYANGDGKEHSIITMMTLHEFANVATLQLFDDSISLDATHVALTSTHGEGSIQLNGDTEINGNTRIWGQFQVVNLAGEIKMWAGDAIPYGWLLCDGSEVSKTDYPELYGAIGDLWGVPSSSSNFKLPNLTGRVPVGYNSADTDTTETFGKVGATGGARGAWYHTHTIGSSGAHHHASVGRVEGSGSGANIFESFNGASKTRAVNVPRSGSNGAHTHSPGSSGSTGNKLAVDKANMPPYAVVKYIICAF